MKEQTPSRVQELRDESEAVEEKRALAMNKLVADRALAAVAVLESKINEVNAIAEQEAALITGWQEPEAASCAAMCLSIHIQLSASP